MQAERKENDGRPIITLKRRTPPQISDDGVIQTKPGEVRHLPRVVNIEVRRKKPKKVLDKIVQFFVMVEQHMGVIPANIHIKQNMGKMTLSLNNGFVCGRLLQISAIGQSIQDWVKTTGPIWLNIEPTTQPWVQAKAVE